jgi:hypothetical protein
MGGLSVTGGREEGRWWGQPQRQAHLQGLDGGDGAGVAAQHERVEQLRIHIAQRGMHDRPACWRRRALAPQRLQHIAEAPQQALLVIPPNPQPSTCALPLPTCHSNWALWGLSWGASGR